MGDYQRAGEEIEKPVEAPALISYNFFLTNKKTAMLFEVIIKATREQIKVYKLKSGNYHDYENMGASEPPKAVKAGKKEFTPGEVQVVKELD